MPITNQRLIICDDSKQDFELLSLALQELNFSGEVIWLKDGEEAIHFFQGIESFADKETEEANYLLLLDLNMPKRNGFEVLEFLGSLGNKFSLPCIVLTTSQSSHDTKKAFELGANAFVVKPFDFGDLKNNVSSILDFWFEKSVLPLSKLPFPGDQG